MPELPEIETVKLQLQKVLPGQEILSIDVRGAKTVIGDHSLLKNKKVKQVRRMAKVLIVDFVGDISMAFHFKMTGQLIYDTDDNGDTFKDRIAGGHPTEDFTGKLPSTHTRIIFKLSKGNLFFNDQRMFGWAKIDTTEKIEQMKFLQELGPEPFNVDVAEFIARIGKSRRPIKIAIMDQTVVAGVGNIYANDALWEAYTHPKRAANALTDKEYEDLLVGLQKVLTEGIKYGGATAADAKYINLHGLGGKYQEHFRTYDREGLPCLRCKTPITRITLGGRGTFFCEKCQV